MGANPCLIWDLRTTFGFCYIIATGSILGWWICGCIGRRWLDFPPRQKEVNNDTNSTTNNNYDPQRTKRGCGWPRRVPQMVRMHFIWKQQRKSQTWSWIPFTGCIQNIFCKQKYFLQQGCVVGETLTILWQNCDSCCMFRPQKNLQNRSGNDGCSFSPVASICRRPAQPNKLAEPMARNFTWLECSGSKICSGSSRFDVVAAKPTTIVAFMFPHCWFTWCLMGIKNCGLETPEY